MVFDSMWHSTESMAREICDAFIAEGISCLLYTSFHPAAALRNPAWQALLEEDFRMLGAYLAEHPVDVGLNEMCIRDRPRPPAKAPNSQLSGKGCASAQTTRRLA